MSSKQQKIQEKLAKPIAAGDFVDVSVPYTRTETQGKGKAKKDVQEQEHKKTSYVEVVEVLPGNLFAVRTGDSWSPPYTPETAALKGDYPHGTYVFRGEWLTQNTDHCGADPFVYNAPRISFYNQDISSLLWRAGYDHDKNNSFSQRRKFITDKCAESDRPYIGTSHGGVDFDPVVKDAEGREHHYQRGLVWSLEQKQLLVESVYRQVEIGKFVFRKRSWRSIQKNMLAKGHGYDYDCCDGKQRLDAIVGFVTNAFPDFGGNYFRDLSERAQRCFLGFDRLSYGELDEGTTDKMTLLTFLNLNFAGTPIGEAHTEFVKSIKI
jgi:hypothetical protein